MESFSFSFQSQTQFSVFSFQFSVFSFQFSVFEGIIDLSYSFESPIGRRGVWRRSGPFGLQQREREKDKMGKGKTNKKVEDDDLVLQEFQESETIATTPPAQCLSFSLSPFSLSALSLLSLSFCLSFTQRVIFYYLIFIS